MTPLPLVERSKEEIARAIEKRVRTVEGVRECTKPSIRLTGKRVRVAVSVSLDSNLEFERTHRIGLTIEREVKKLLPNARIVIRTGPFHSNLEETWELVRKAAEDVPGTRWVSNIHLQKIAGRLALDLVLEVGANMTIKQTQGVSQELEKRIRAIIPSLAEVNVCAETALDRISRERTGVGTELQSYVVHVAKRFPEIRNVHRIKVRRVGDDLYLILECLFDPDLKVKKATALSNELERLLRTAYPEITHIIIKKECLDSSGSREVDRTRQVITRQGG